MSNTKVMKVTSNEQTITLGKNVYSLHKINLDLRRKVNDLVFENHANPSFSLFIDVIQMCVKISDDQLMELSNEQISELFQKVVDCMNPNSSKKK